MKVRRRFIHITPVKLPSAVETFKPHGRTVAALVRQINSNLMNVLDNG
ncbi:hypothetical protein ACFQDF_19955 [Ectobacillus funiculus]